MYGWINCCIENAILKYYGNECWQKILEECHIGEDFVRSIKYDDDITYNLVGAASKILNISIDALIEGFGRHFVKFVREYGFDRTMSSVGKTFKQWLYNINEPHRLLKTRFPESQFPDFWCTDSFNNIDVSSDEQFVTFLHYKSSRVGLSKLAAGVVKQVGYEYFGIEVEMVEVLVGEDNTTVWKVRRLADNIKQFNKSIFSPFHPNGETILSESTFFLKPELSRSDSSSGGANYGIAYSESNTAVTSPRCPFSMMNEVNIAMQASPTPMTSGCESGLTPSTLKQLFPFHFVVNRELVIIQFGNRLSSFISNNLRSKRHGNFELLNRKVESLFYFSQPVNGVWSWQTLQSLQDFSVSLMLCETRVELKGSVTIIQYNSNEDQALFLVSPNASSIKDLRDYRLHLTDIPHHSFQRDAIMLNDQIKAETELTIKLDSLTKKLEEEKRISTETLKTKRVFVRYVSHEIRTPLNVSLLGMQYLENELDELLQTKRSSEHNLAALSEDIQTNDQLKIVIPNEISVHLRNFNASNSNDLTVPPELEKSIKSHTDDSIETQREQGNETPQRDTEKFHHLKEILSDVQSSCLVAVEILNDLLLYEKIESGILSLSLQETRVSDFATNTISSFKLQAVSAGVLFESFYNPIINEDPALAVQIDQTKLSQVFRNLISNAIKFTPTGGRVTVSCQLLPITSAASPFDREIYFTNNFFMAKSDTRASASSSYQIQDSSNQHSRAASSDEQSSCEDLKDSAELFFRIYVSDSGSGISKRDQLNLFREFSQVKAETLQKGQGSGLGLWIARNIVRLHNGRIGVYSRGEGFGSVFVVDIPLCVAENSEEIKAKVQQHILDIQAMHSGEAGIDPMCFCEIFMKDPTLVKSPSSKTRGKKPKTDAPSTFLASATSSLTGFRLLVVDDIALNRKMVKRLLANYFTCIDEAENGEEAVQAYARALGTGNPYHIIMMDYFMPVMNGLEATTAIKRMHFEYQQGLENSIDIPHGMSRVLIIGVTGNGLKEDTNAFLDAGADKVMVKPLDVKDFIEFILHNNL